MLNIFALTWRNVTRPGSELLQARQAERHRLAEVQAKRDELKALILKG